jgi:hypothetical protein
MKILQTLFTSMKLTKHTLLITIILMSFFVSSQEKENALGALVTDRPDATEASSTVGKGILQFETGGFYETFEENNIKLEDYTFNTMLIRYGLLDNLELRLG